MQPVSLALFWHQHQPYYPDALNGENLMPWVRLHGTKDYYGMALHIKEVPEFRCTINLVPSLLLQLQAYTDHNASDRHLDVSRIPADSFGEAEIHYLLDNFFMANLDSMIRRYPRYHELYLKRGFGIDSAAKAAPRFNARDIRDLQVWSNLTWFHPLAFEVDAELKKFFQKGQHWTEDEKEWLLEKQMDILRQVIPLHRELVESGQVELTTTPFYHPILPLLWDKRSARQAMPGCTLPKHLEPYREDAVHHIRRGVSYHSELFGEAPVGMWPSEGSVSQDIVSAIAQAGIEWIATDEEILSASTNGWVSRDGHGHIRNPEMLYRPWRVESGSDQLQIIFRDHALSDLIGFHYQRSDPAHAANDLIGRLSGISKACEHGSGGRPALVPIILDGENCWEYYHDGGVAFLRTLYQNCASSNFIRPVRVCDHLREYPASDRISQLFAGSWISHNFAIWIGHSEDHRAWDLLHETREFLVRAEKREGIAPEVLKQAWEEIYIAEGSDWYWWFGDDHSSAQDELFDQLFRKHLQNVYRLLGVDCPHVLNNPISRAERKPIHTQPTGFLPVQIDGRRTYFEWICGGHFVSGSERGTMTQVTEGVLREIYFGFNVDHLFVRMDTHAIASEDLGGVDEIAIHFLEPEGTEVRIGPIKPGVIPCKIVRNRRAIAKSGAEAALDQILEVSIPFADLKVQAEETIQFRIDTYSGGQCIDRLPQEGVISTKAPSPDFELIMWQV